MINKKISSYLLFLALLATIASCNKEDYTGYSTLTATDAKGTLSWSAPTALTETDTTFTFTVTLDKPQIADIHINISQVDGDATSGSDFEVTGEIIIPAYATSGTGEFKVFGDAEVEGTETVTIQIGDNSLSNLDLEPQTRTVQIGNYVAPMLDLVFDWGGTVTVDGTEVSLCSAVDIDVYVYDVDENDLGIYGAATGSCPEHLVFDGMDDGDYYLWANLYANDARPTDGSVIGFPVTVYATQSGLFENTVYSQAEANALNSSDPDYATDGANTFKPIVKVTVAGANYTITVL